MQRYLTLGATLVIVLVSCRGVDAPLVTVSDSSGVRITLSREADGPVRVVDSVPTVSIGARDAEGPAQFFQIEGVYVDRVGRIWVGDGRSSELRIFHPEGTHWKTVGGKGAGPGEFEAIRLLGSFSGDSVAVSDRSLGRLTTYDSEANFVRTARLAGQTAPPRFFDVFPDGSALARAPRGLDISALRPDLILRDSVRLARVDFRSDRLVEFAEVEGPLWLWTGTNQVPVPFTANPGVAVEGEAVHVVAGTEFRVRVYENGGLVEIYGVVRDPRPVTDSHLDEYRATTNEYLPERLRGDYLAVLDHPARPLEAPAYSNVVISTVGEAWVQWYDPDNRWDVYGTNRTLIASVEVPSGFILLHVTDSLVAGVWRDVHRVEHVRVYPLRSGG